LIYFCKLNNASFNPFSSLLCNFSTRSAASNVGALTNLKALFAAIALLKFSFVTSPSESSRSANCVGGSGTFRDTQSWRTTSTTVRAGSIRTRTVIPSRVVTVLVGTRVLADFGRAVAVSAEPKLGLKWDDEGERGFEEEREVESGGGVDDWPGRGVGRWETC
jgi:hypothetical protein